MAHVWRHHLSTQELGQRLGLKSIDMEIARRQLALGGARQPHGLRDAPTASHAFVVGATSAASGRADDDIRALHLQGHGQAPGRHSAMARAGGEPLCVARDAADGARSARLPPADAATLTAHLTHEASAQLRTGYCCGH